MSKKIQIKIGKYCKEHNYDICKKHADLIITYDNEKELDHPKILRHLPPYHPFCQCKQENFDEENQVLHIDIEGIIETMKADSIAMILKPENSDLIYQVALTKEEEQIVMDCVSELHGEKIKVVDKPLSTIALKGRNE